MMEKVLIVIGDATELLDTMYPYYRLQEAGFQPVVWNRSPGKTDALHQDGAKVAASVKTRSADLLYCLPRLCSE